MSFNEWKRENELKCDYVLERLIEAAHTWGWAVKGAKPQKRKDSIIIVSHGVIGGFSPAWKRRMQQYDPPHTIRDTNKKVTNADECLGWLASIPDEQIRSALALFIKLKVEKQKISQYCKKNGLNRAKFYRQKDKAIQYLVSNLCLKHHFRDIEEFDSVRQKKAKSRANQIELEEFRPPPGDPVKEGVLKYDKKGRVKRIL